VNTYLQGRKITATRNYERPAAEALHLIRKLRWIGMEEEAERVATSSTVEKSARQMGTFACNWGKGLARD
jgi:hypothetical protein